MNPDWQIRVNGKPVIGREAKIRRCPRNGDRVKSWPRATQSREATANRNTGSREGARNGMRPLVSPETGPMNRERRGGRWYR